MAWKETCPMWERIAFVHELQRGDRSMTDVCQAFGISRKTGYKVWARYQRDGCVGLADRSRAPHRHPNALAPTLATQLLELRAQHPTWGPQKLLDWMELHQPATRLPAVSTVAMLLQRHGLVQHGKPRQRSVPYGAPFARATSANVLWTADFKGQFRTHDQRYCYPLTISDAFSRFLLSCQALLHPTSADSRRVFERAFREYGLPSVIRTDNGAPFASTGLGGLSALSLWWLRLGIVPERIAVGHPEQNGRHERMHRTLKQDCPVCEELGAQQQALDRFRHVYNEQRPHRALQGQTPAMHYHHSPRVYPRRLAPFSYPDGYAVRRVFGGGEIAWGGRTWYIAQLAAGEWVGLKPMGDGVWEMHIGPLKVGHLDVRHKRIQPIATEITRRTIH